MKVLVKNSIKSQKSFSAGSLETNKEGLYVHR